MAIVLATSGCAVQWTLDYDDGLKRARDTKKPMLLYFKDWSSSLHRDLVVKVLESPVVARELQDTVNVELLFNWGPAVAQYKIETAQVCVFCGPDGAEIDRLYVNPLPAPDKFADWIRRCKAAARAASTQPSRIE